MVDSFTESSSTGLMGNMGKSLMMVPIGILLFFGSFLLIWSTSGRADFSKIVTLAEDAPADTAGGQDGKFVAVTGALAAPGTLGDKDFIAPGEYIKLQRRSEMYAWDEKKKSEQTKKVGGGSKTTTTYTYDMAWASSPDDSTKFKRPEGHTNPTMAVQSQSFTAESVTVGAWMLKTDGLRLPGAKNLALEGLTLVGKGLTAKRMGDTLYIGKGTHELPLLGDLRVTFSALTEGGRNTAFGEGLGKELVPYLHKGEDKMFRVMRGTRDEATLALKNEFKSKGKLGYIAGFIIMWLGMTMVFAPLHGVMDILPFAGKISRGLVGCITFPIAMLLAGIAIVLSVIAHSPIVLAGLFIALIGGGVFLWKNKKAKA
jgi:hypothetical protein